jgi:hypothetical protein
MRTLQVQRALAVRGFLAHGVLEGVVAAGGEMDRAFAELHRLFDGHDLQTGDWGEAGFFVQARRRGFGQGREDAGRELRGQESLNLGLLESTCAYSLHLAGRLQDVERPLAAVCP